MQDAGEAVLRMSKDMDNGTGRWGPWPQKTWRVHEVGGARLITQVARVFLVSATKFGCLGS